MDDARWNRLQQRFPRALAGAQFDAAPRAPSAATQPPFLAAAFSPDESRIAFAGGGRIPKRPDIWIARLPRLETEVMIRGHQGLHALAWDDATELLASASNDYCVALWDVARRDHVFVCGGDQPIVKGHVAFGDGALYIGETEAFEGLRARLLRADLATGELETLHALPDGHAITALAVAGSRWACASDDFHYSGSPRLRIGEVELEAEVVALAWSGDELRWIQRSDDALELCTVQSRRSIGAPDADSAALSRDGQLAAVASVRSLAAFATTGEGASALWSVELPGDGIAALAWSGSGARIAAAGFGWVTVLDGRTGATVATAVPPAWFQP